MVFEVNFNSKWFLIGRPIHSQVFFFFLEAGDVPVNSDAGGIPRSLKKLLDDLKNSSNAKQLTVGAVSGWATGYLAAKFGKIVATAIGGSLLLIQVLERWQFMIFRQK